VFFKAPRRGGGAGRALPPRKLAALFLCAVLTGYFDYALELVSDTELRGSALDALVRELASAASQQAADAVRELSRTVERDAGRANLEVGRFVDERRHYCDYHEVFAVSSLPRDYK